MQSPIFIGKHSLTLASNASGRCLSGIDSTDFEKIHPDIVHFPVTFHLSACRGMGTHPARLMTTVKTQDTFGNVFNQYLPFPFSVYHTIH